MQYNLKFSLSQSRTQRRRADNPFINVVVGSFFVNKVILSAQRDNKKNRCFGGWVFVRQNKIQ